MIEYKGRVESYSREMLRKESQIKELQGRIETGDGCEYFFRFDAVNDSIGIILFLYLIMKLLFHNINIKNFHAFFPKGWTRKNNNPKFAFLISKPEWVESLTFFCLPL